MCRLFKYFIFLTLFLIYENNPAWGDDIIYYTKNFEPLGKSYVCCDNATTCKEIMPQKEGYSIICEKTTFHQGTLLGKKFKKIPDSYRFSKTDPFQRACIKIKDKNYGYWRAEGTDHHTREDFLCAYKKEDVECTSDKECIGVCVNNKCVSHNIKPGGDCIDDRQCDTDSAKQAFCVLVDAQGNKKCQPWYSDKAKQVGAYCDDRTYTNAKKQICTAGYNHCKFENGQKFGKCAENSKEGGPCTSTDQCFKHWENGFKCVAVAGQPDVGKCMYQAKEGEKCNIALFGDPNDKLDCEGGSLACLPESDGNMVCRKACEVHNEKLEAPCRCGGVSCPVGKICRHYKTSTGNFVAMNTNQQKDEYECVNEETFKERGKDKCLPLHVNTDASLGAGKCWKQTDGTPGNCMCGDIYIDTNYRCVEVGRYDNLRAVPLEDIQKVIDNCTTMCPSNCGENKNTKCYCGTMRLEFFPGESETSKWWHIIDTDVLICSSGQFCNLSEKKCYDSKEQCSNKCLTDEYTLYDADGRVVCISARGDYAGGTFSGCKAMPNRVNESRQCFICPFFKVVFEAMDSVSYDSMNLLRNGFISVLAVVMAIYIAIVTLSHVSQFTKQEAPKYLNTIIKQSFKFIIAILMLIYYRQVYDWVVVPLLHGGLTLSENMISADPTFTARATASGDPYVDGVTVNTKIFGYSDGKGGVENTIYNAVRVYLQKIQYHLGFMQSVGQGLICAAGSTFSSLSISQFGDGFKMLGVGIIIAVFALLLSFACGFYLIDAIVQIGICGSLMPLLVLCWPFKATSKYARKGVEWLINVFVVFTMMAILLNINFKLVDEAISQGGETVGAFSSTCVKEIKCAVAGDELSRILSAVDVYLYARYGYLIDLFGDQYNFSKVDPSCNIPLLDGGGAAYTEDDRIICAPCDFLKRMRTCDEFKLNGKDTKRKGEEKISKTAADVIGEDATKNSRLAGIYDAIHLNDYPRLLVLVDISAKGFLIIIIACMFAYKLVAQVNSLANKFAGGAISGIGASIATAGASTAKGMLTSLTKPMREGVGEGIGNAVESASKSVTTGAIKLPFRAVKYAFSSKYRDKVHNNVREGIENRVNKVRKFLGKDTENYETTQSASAPKANPPAPKPPAPSSSGDSKSQTLAFVAKKGDTVVENKDGTSTVKHSDGTTTTVANNGSATFASGVTSYTKDGKTHYKDSSGKEITKEQADALNAATQQREREFLEAKQKGGLQNNTSFSGVDDGDIETRANILKEENAREETLEDGSRRINYADGTRATVHRDGNVTFETMFGEENASNGSNHAKIYRDVTTSKEISEQVALERKAKMVERMEKFYAEKQALESVPDDHIDSLNKATLRKREQPEE